MSANIKNLENMSKKNRKQFKEQFSGHTKEKQFVS